MISTFFSLCIAALLIKSPIAVESLHLLITILFAMSALLFFTCILIHCFSFSPLQKTEHSLTPRVVELFQKDPFIKYTSLYLYLFPLISFLITANLTLWHFLPASTSLAIWIIFFGIAIDALQKLIFRMMSYNNPFDIVDHLTTQAMASIKENQETDLLDWIDALSEITIKASDKALPSLSIKSIESLKEVCFVYLQSSKSIAKHMTEENSKENDTISYTLFYLLKRLELIFERAAQHKMEPICSTLVTTVGKMIIDCAKFDLSTTLMPLRVLGSFANTAQERKMLMIRDKTACTFLETAKAIIEEVDIRYLELQPPYFCMIKYMEQIATDTFKEDRSTNLSILIEPFKELKNLFSQQKMQSHQDSKIIIADIERVIDKFNQLQVIMQTMPKTETPKKS